MGAGQVGTVILSHLGDAVTLFLFLRCGSSLAYRALAPPDDPTVVRNSVRKPSSCSRDVAQMCSGGALSPRLPASYSALSVDAARFARAVNPLASRATDPSDSAAPITETLPTGTSAMLTTTLNLPGLPPNFVGLDMLRVS